jgi:hypothetical protein
MAKPKIPNIYTQTVQQEQKSQETGQPDVGTGKTVEQHPALEQEPQTILPLIPQNAITTEQQDVVPSEPQNAITVKRQTVLPSEPQSTTTVEPLAVLPSEQLNSIAVDEDEDEKADIKFTLYLFPYQDDKLDELARIYKKHTRKKLTRNKILRKLIDKATVDDLL